MHEIKSVLQLISSMGPLFSSEKSRATVSQTQISLSEKKGVAKRDPTALVFISMEKKGVAKRDPTALVFISIFVRCLVLPRWLDLTPELGGVVDEHFPASGQWYEHVLLKPDHVSVRDDRLYFKTETKINTSYLVSVSNHTL